MTGKSETSRMLETALSTGKSSNSVMPVEQVRALVRLLYPEYMTPVARRQIESACDAADMHMRCRP